MLAKLPWEDAGLRQGCVAKLGHTFVMDAAFSPAGRYLASADEHGEVTIWDLGTGQARHKFPGAVLRGFGDARGRPRLAFSADGRALIVAAEVWGIGVSNDRPELEVAIRQVDTGKLARTVSIPPCGRLAFASDGWTVALSTTHFTLELWDLKKGRKIRSLPFLKTRALAKDRESVNAMAFSPTEPLFASGHFGKVLLWNLESGRLIHVLETGYGHHDMAFAPDGSLLAVAAHGVRKVHGVGVVHGEIQVWERRNHEPWLLENASHTWLSLSFSPDGTLLCTSRLGQSRFWDVKAAKRLGAASDGDPVFSPGGVLLAMQHRGVRLWRVADVVKQRMADDDP